MPLMKSSPWYLGYVGNTVLLLYNGLTSHSVSGSASTGRVLGTGYWRTPIINKRRLQSIMYSLYSSILFQCFRTNGGNVIRTRQTLLCLMNNYNAAARISRNGMRSAFQSQSNGSYRVLLYTNLAQAQVHPTSNSTHTLNGTESLSTKERVVSFETSTDETFLNKTAREPLSVQLNN